jgi:hypothetical protein
MDGIPYQGYIYASAGASIDVEKKMDKKCLIDK